jgi:hypothetical protein
MAQTRVEAHQMKVLRIPQYQKSTLWIYFLQTTKKPFSFLPLKKI